MMKAMGVTPLFFALLGNLASAEDTVKNVAIIGAGAAGASTAYHIRKFADESNVAVNITVFEKTDRIGGRTLTVNAWDNKLLPVELGASIFIEDNKIMYEAVTALNLSFKQLELGEDDGAIGIWNGQEFVVYQKNGDLTWAEYIKLFFRYGLAPIKAQKLVKATVSKFLKIYDQPYFPFSSLTKVISDLDLDSATGIDAVEFLGQNGIGEKFSSEVIQAATRVNYAANLRFIHGLESMVSMAPEGASQVEGGNWRIFSRMIEETRGHFNPNTTVSHIGYAKGSTDKFITKSQVAGQSIDNPTVFDDVVIANPFQFGNISVPSNVFKKTIDEIPYMKLHVTLFATPLRLSQKYFGLKDDVQSPNMVLTTLHPDDIPKQGPDGAGKPGFFSISILRRAMNPHTGDIEYLWKIFSPEAVSPEFMSKILDTEIPASFTGNTTAGKASPVTWYYPHVFYSYPIELPRVTFQDPELNKGLWYTSGIEPFISTMETSALMGKNVARLIMDEYINEKSKRVMVTSDEL